MQDMILTREYKGYTIRLHPVGNYCSNFAVEMQDECGNVVRHVPAAGSTEETALARAREMIDIDLELGR